MEKFQTKTLIAVVIFVQLQQKIHTQEVQARTSGKGGNFTKAKTLGRPPIVLPTLPIAKPVKMYVRNADK